MEVTCAKAVVVCAKAAIKDGSTMGKDIVVVKYEMVFNTFIHKF